MNNETAPTGSALRNQLDDVMADNRALTENLTQRKQHRLIADAGFDPASPEGKALALVYDGDADEEQVRAFAQDRYGWQAPGHAAEQAAQAERERSAAWDHLNAVTARASGAPPVTSDDKIDHAEATGDWATYDRLQAEKLHAVRTSSAQYRFSPPAAAK